MESVLCIESVNNENARNNFKYFYFIFFYENKKEPILSLHQRYEKQKKRPIEFIKDLL